MKTSSLSKLGIRTRDLEMTATSKNVGIKKFLNKRVAPSLALIGLSLSPILALPQTANAALVCEVNFKLDGTACQSVVGTGTLTFTIPAGVTEVQALLMGAGGGGGGGGAYDNGGGSTTYLSGGGGGAGEVKGVKVTVSAGNVLTLVGGAGGSLGTVLAKDGDKWAGTDGGDGTNSTVSLFNGTTTTVVATARAGKGGKSGSNGGGGGASGDGVHVGGAGYNNIKGQTFTAGGGGGGIGSNGIDGALNKGGNGGDTDYIYPQTLIGANNLFPYFSSYAFPADYLYPGQAYTSVGGWIGAGAGGGVALNTCNINTNTGRGGRQNLTSSPSNIGFAGCVAVNTGAANGKQHNNGSYYPGQGGMAGAGNGVSTGDGLAGNYGYVWIRYAALQGVAPTAPTAPTVIAGDTTANVSWVASSAGSAPITYAVISSPAGGVCRVTGLTANCTGLTNGTAYTFTVRAINTTGFANSVASNAVTPSNLPGVPGAPTVVASDKKVTVTPTAATNGTPATSYLVTSAPGGKTCTVTLPATSCDVTGLTNGTSYTFVAQAINANGSSANSAPSVAIKAGVPDVAPTEDDGNVPAKTIDPTGAFVATNDSTFLLSWDKANGKLGSKATGIYTGYIQAVATFKVGDVTHTCSTVFGTLKVMPMKTTAQKTASMKSKTFTGKQFCIDNIKMDAKTLTPKGGMTAANFKKIKSMKKTSAELAAEKLALAALKNFTGEVAVQVTRYRAWPTTMVNLREHNSKGVKIPFLVRNTKVNLG